MSINNILPKDDLYWSEVDKKYSALSDEEIERLCIMSVENGLDADETHIAVNAFSDMKVAQLILKRVLNGQVVFSVKNGELVFRADNDE